MSQDDYATEVAPGLPEHLPRGETLLWQGAPDWRLMAWRCFHVREVMVYFAVLIGWAGFRIWWEGGGLAKAAAGAGTTVIPALLAIGLLCLLAWLAARSTVYTITDRRLVMRFGIVLPMTFNLPFTVISRADADLRPDGSGDISVALTAGQGFSYFVLWPHARPWRLRQAEPALRALANGQAVANLLAAALKAAAGQTTSKAADEAAQATKAARPGLEPVLDLGRPAQPAMQASHV